MIEQAKGTTIKEVEVMYWLLEAALDEGKSEKAQMMFHYLAYLAKYNPKMIRDGLQPPFQERLKEISYEIYGDGAIKKQPPITMKQEISTRKIPFKTEKELSNYLLDNPHILSDALEESVKITGREAELEHGYRCDVVAESKTMLYPIELKIAQGTHAVVSQCSKYCYYFYRKLRYDRFKYVQGVVLASGYDSWSVNAIRQEGHWIYTIVPSGTGIVLSRIK